MKNKINLIRLTIVVSVFLFNIKSVEAQTLSNEITNEKENNILFQYPYLSDGLDRDIITNDKWRISLFPTGSFNRTNVRNTAAFYEIADVVGDNYFIGPREWGYSFHHLEGDSESVLQSGPHDGYYDEPTDRVHAYNMMHEWFENTRRELYGSSKYIMTLNGHYFYHHYGAEWANSDIVGIEVGENIVASNPHVAFARGASRQFGKKWGFDFSPWYDGKMRDYSASWTKIADSVVDFQIVSKPLVTRIGMINEKGEFWVKKVGINENWELLAEDAVAFQLTTNRIGVVQLDGTLSVKEGDLNSNYQVLAGDVTDFQLEGNRVAVLQSSGKLSIKEGDLNSNYQVLAGDVVDFQLEGNRVAVLQSSGKLSIKEGDLNSNYQVLAGDVTDFQLEGNRVAVLQSDGKLSVKEGALNSNYQVLAGDVVDFQLENRRVAIIQEYGKLSVKEGDLDADYTHIADDVIDVDLADHSRISILQSSHRLSTKDGDIGSSWYADLMPDVRKQMVEGVFTGVLTNKGQLYMKSGNGAQNEPTSSLTWKDGGGPFYGHSLSLTRRMYYYAYMSGANVLFPEGGFINFFQTPDLDRDGFHILSPMGRLGQDIYDFSHNVLPDRGVSWAPVAIMMDKYHGLGLESWEDDEVFCSLSANGTFDRMNISLLKAIWPNALKQQNGSDESGFQVNNYLGDIFDVVLENTSLNVMKKYPVIVLSGNISLTESMVQKLTNYVNGGGNLVVNSAYAEANSSLRILLGIQFGGASNTTIKELQWEPTQESYNMNGLLLNTAYLSLNTGTEPLMKAKLNNDSYRTVASVRSVGSGKAICLAFQHMTNITAWQVFLNYLTSDVAVKPFLITGGSIQHLYNYNDNEWQITLINNEGVNKDSAEPQVIIPLSGKTINLHFQEPGKNIFRITNLMTDQELSNSNGDFSVYVPAGDVVVLKVQTVNTSTTLKSGEINAPETTTLTPEITPVEVEAYPNPVKDWLYVSQEVDQLDFVNVSGVKIKSEKNTNSINVSGCKPGLYFLRVQNGQTPDQWIKIIKQ